jgi:hypothetical protein
MFWVLATVLEISAALALGFIGGRFGKSGVMSWRHELAVLRCHQSPGLPVLDRLRLEKTVVLGNAVMVASPGARRCIG